MAAVNRPLVSADIICRQNQNSGLCNAKPPTWTAIMPTPELEAKGLTSITLTQIIDSINNTAQTDFESKFKTYYFFLTFLPCIGVLIGFIIFISSAASMDLDSSMSGSVAGIIVLTLSGFLNICCCVGVSRLYMGATQFALDNMKRYVEITLNEQWQRENGIRWTIITEQTISTHGHGDDRSTTTTTWHHIGITSLQNAVVIQPVVLQSQVLVPIQASEGAGHQVTHT